MNLAQLVSDADDFKSAFTMSMNDAPREPPKFGQADPDDKTDMLLEASRSFKIGLREFMFDDKDYIFIRTDPVHQKDF